AADAPSARGNMWGSSAPDAPSESLGHGGLALSGVGEGGGGKGEGIGLGSIGTTGRGAGADTGQGFGGGQGRLSGTHRAAPPRVRSSAASVSGRIPPEVIQRVVRQIFGRLRLCYERGLEHDAKLAGRISVRFLIGPTGAVSAASDGGSDLGDPSV